jgi:hypothetical protein
MEPSNPSATLFGSAVGRHIHFDDRAAVPWHKTLASALAQAALKSKCVWVQIGRADCGGSRALIERVLPKEEISEALRAGFVCVCSDEKALDPDVAERLAALPRREPTPLCIYLDAAGHVLYSTVGGRPPAVFLRDLTEAEARARAAARAGGPK